MHSQNFKKDAMNSAMRHIRWTILVPHGFTGPNLKTAAERLCERYIGGKLPGIETPLGCCILFVLVDAGHALHIFLWHQCKHNSTQYDTSGYQSHSLAALERQHKGNDAQPKKTTAGIGADNGKNGQNHQHPHAPVDPFTACGELHVAHQRQRHAHDQSKLVVVAEEAAVGAHDMKTAASHDRKQPALGAPEAERQHDGP